MRLRKVADVNVVANARAIGRWIIVSKESHWFARLNSAKNKRDQVRLRVVPFAESGLRLRAAGIEIAQADASEIRGTGRATRESSPQSLWSRRKD